MRDLVNALAACLDDAIAVQSRLLDRIIAQRAAILANDSDLIETAAREMETDVLRLGGIESTRTRVAAELADELGVIAARWGVIREALDDEEREFLAPRVARVEDLVRDLELHNAINGQLVATELTLVDVSIRTIASGDPQAVTRAYTSGGTTPAPTPRPPVLLNLAA